MGANLQNEQQIPSVAMPQPDEATPEAKGTAQGTAQGMAKKRPRGRPWPKGVSGNPAGRPRNRGRVKTVFISERDFVRLLARYLANLSSTELGHWRKSLPGDCKVVSCAVDQAQGEVVFILGSSDFPLAVMGKR